MRIPRRATGFTRDGGPGPSRPHPPGRFGHGDHHAPPPYDVPPALRTPHGRLCGRSPPAAAPAPARARRAGAGRRPASDAGPRMARTRATRSARGDRPHGTAPRYADREAEETAGRPGGGGSGRGSRRRAVAGAADGDAAGAQRIDGPAECGEAGEGDRREDAYPDGTPGGDAVRARDLTPQSAVRRARWAAADERGDSGDARTVPPGPGHRRSHGRGRPVPRHVRPLTASTRAGGIRRRSTRSSWTRALPRPACPSPRPGRPRCARRRSSGARRGPRTGPCGHRRTRP